jgi:starch synthase
LGAGLKSVLAKRKNDLYGIINGIDTSVWNPEKDKHLEKKYSAKNLSLKLVNKQVLAEKFGFKYDENIPIIGMISRLYEAKGYDLIMEVFPELMKMNLRMVLLGTGSKKYHNFFEKMANKYPDKFACYLGFNDEIAHLIEGGADIFMMPSRYEPCGLNQMYSLNYGTVPLVRETGGLADTVVRFNEKTGEGNGFSFKQYEGAALIKELKRALKIFEDKKTWSKIMREGMKCDFSWSSSAKKYIELYKTMLNNE